MEYEINILLYTNKKAYGYEIYYPSQRARFHYIFGYEIYQEHAGILASHNGCDPISIGNYILIKI